MARRDLTLLESHSHIGRQKAGPILAISAKGTVTKANLLARKAFAQEEPLEEQDLGSVLARVMTGTGIYPEQLTLHLPSRGGPPHEVLLVLSDQEDRPALPPAKAPEPQSIRAADSVNVADFIAHELRNRIAITLGLSQVLEANFERIEATERGSALRSIQVESEHALMVLDGLLRVVESRRRSGPSSAGVPVHSVIRRIMTEHRRRYPERTLVVGGDTPLFALGDSAWLQIAIANLVSNAEKVTPRDQTIAINARQEGDRVIVLVQDQGKALEAHLYQQLWDIYTKGAPEGVEISGSGIGLAICKELVGSMGGRVWAGPNDHGGSAFAISLQGSSEANLIRPRSQLSTAR